MNELANNYRYIITTRLDTREEFPLREGDFVIEWQRNDEEKRDYEKQMTSKVLFRGQAYTRLLKLEQSIYRCDLIGIVVQRRCGDNWISWVDGRISLNDGDWDLDRCEVSLELLEQKPDQCFTDNKGTELNIFSRVLTRYTVRTISPNITIEKVTYEDAGGGPDPCEGGYYWGGGGDPNLGGWVVYYHDEHMVDEFSGCVRTTKWARQLLTVACNEEAPGPEWLLILDECATGGTRQYAKAVSLYNCVYTYPDYNAGYTGMTMSCDIVGDAGNVATIDNGMHLRDVLNAFLAEFCTGITLKSNFFAINPDNTPVGNAVYSGTSQIIISGSNIRLYSTPTLSIKSGMLLTTMGITYTIVQSSYVASPGYYLFVVDRIGPAGTYPSAQWGIFNGSTGVNYVTGAPTKVANIFMFKKSDVKRPTATGNATIANVTFEKLMNDLVNMFNLKWRFENGVFVVEHVSFFSKGAGFDLTSSKYSAWVKGKAKYSYDNSKIPQREEFTFMESSGADFVGLPIIYNSTCTASGSKDNIEKHAVEIITTDVQYCLSNPESDSNKVSDDGFVLMATYTNGSVYWVISESPILGGSTLNNSLSWAHLHRDYHKHYRPLRRGIMNGQQTEFLSVRPIKIGEPITIPLCCTDNFNPDNSIKTVLGNGVVDKATFSFKTEKLTLNLLYAADDGLILNRAPVANPDVATTYQNVPVTIDVLANDTDPDGNSAIQGIIIVTPPMHGTATITPENKILYTPNLSYNGDDYILYKCYDDWKENSNNALVSITIYPPNQPPVANDDNYSMGMNGVLNVPAPGVFSNDSDDIGFSLDGYTQPVSAGSSVVVNPDGSFTYTPAVGFYGDDSFTYTIIDGTSQTATATVYIFVRNYSLPVSADDLYTTIRNQSVNIAAPGVLGNDTAPLTGGMTAVSGPRATSQGGSATVNSNGSFIYTPPNGFTGSDTFTYQAQNSGGQPGNTATVTINVLPNIYVRFVKADEIVEFLEIECGFGPEPGGQINRAQYVASFFQDSAGTVPYNVTGLGLVLNIRNVIKYSMNDPNPTVTTQTASGANGTMWVVYDGITSFEQRLQCGGSQTYYYDNTRTLAPGNYIII